MKTRFVIVVGILVGITLLGYNACKPNGDSIGSNSTTFGNPIVQAVILPFAPARTHLGCLKSLTYTDGVRSGTQTLSSPIVVQFNASGTNLGELPIEFPVTRIGLEFGPGCEGGPILSRDSFVVNLEDLSISTMENVTLFFNGFYDPADAKVLDLGFNFQYFVDDFENDNTEDDVLASIGVTQGTFGPMTKTQLAPYSSTDTHYGCLSDYIVTDTNMNEYRIRLGPKVVAILPEGSAFEDLGLSPGTYRRVIFNFTTSCPEMPGLGLSSAYHINNSHGTFDLSGLVMRFEGNFSIPEDRNKKLVFNVGPLINHFSTLTHQQDARAMATSAFYLDLPFSPGQ